MLELPLTLQLVLRFARYTSLMCGVLAAIILYSSLLQAQRPGATLEGLVQDSAGAVIPNATVVLKAGHEPTPVLSTTTDSGGKFRFRSITPGTYDLTINREGFQPAGKRVDITSGKPIVITVVLPVATVNQNLDVVDDDTRVAAQSAANQDSINVDQKALEGLPIFDQDYISALQSFLDPSVIATGGVSLVVDGMEANRVGLSPSAIERVTINDDPYAAEFFRPGRGRIEVITKQAAPQYHGTFNFIFRDYHLNASDRFASSKPPEQRRIFEGSLIGPIGKSGKTSFLISGNRAEEDLEAVIFAQNASGQITGNLATPQRNTDFAGRLSHVFNDTHNIAFQYSFHQDSAQNQGVGGVVLSTAGTNANSREDQYQYTDNLIISPNLLSQLQVRFETNHDLTESTDSGQKIVVLDSFTGGGAQVNRLRTEKDIRFNWILTWTKKKHTIKAGINIPNISRRLLLDSNNAAGTFFFSDLASFSANLPYAFTVQQGNGRVVYKQDEIGGFVQDEIKLKPNLSVMLGLRYDWQNAFRDDNNFAPRLSFAYAPGKSRNVVLRGGTGFFYDRTGATPIADLSRFDGQHVSSYVITNPSYPNAFQNGISLASQPTNRVVLSPDAAIPLTLQYSLNLERQLGKATVSVGYRGSQSFNVFRSRDINAPQAPNFLTRPDTTLGTVRQIESTGSQQSNALELSLKGKISRFLSGQAQYTFSKTLNDTSGIGFFPANSFDLTGEWGRSDFDQRHRLNLLEVINAGKFFNLGVGITLASGKPYTLTTGLDLNHDGIANERPSGVSRNSANGPGYADFDLRWSHDFKLMASRKDKSPVATIAFDAFNVFNRSNFVTFIGNQRSPFFGLPIAELPSRRLQMTARFKF
jgi:outer membrane receptor protein involved in Fe transport